MMNYRNEILKPIIGVTTLYDRQKDSMWMLPGYLDGIRLAGGIPLIIPIDLGDEDLERLYAVCNGFLLTGGQDIQPSLYGEADSGKCIEICEKRDSLDSWIFKRAYHDNKAILGICRGFQLINALLGGSLYQHLPSQWNGQNIVSHSMNPPYHREHHLLHVVKDSFLHNLINSDTSGVNSYHHQGIKNLGKDLSVMAYASDGLIEAVECASKRFVIGVQWHPEYMLESDKNSLLLFQALTGAAMQSIC